MPPRPFRGSHALTVVAFCAAAAVLHMGRSVLLPAALAVLGAFTLEPAARRAERALRSRTAAVGLTVATAAAAVAGLAAFSLVQAARFAEQAPEYRRTIVERLGGARAAAAALDHALKDVQSLGEPPAGPPSPRPAASLADLALPATHTAAVFLITALLVAAMLMYREDLRDRLVRILGVRALPLSRGTLEAASARISTYLAAQAAINAGTAVLLGTAFTLLGVPNAPLLGIAAGVLRYIPYLGPLAAVTVAVLASLAASPGWSGPASVLAVFTAVEVAVSSIVEPWLYGRRTGLSFFGVVVATLFWGWLWGAPGLVVAVPLTSCIVLLARHFPAFEPLSVLLGDGPALSPADRLHHRLLDGDARGAALAVQEAAADPTATPDTAERLWLASLHRLARDLRAGALSDAQAESYSATGRALLRRPPDEGKPPALIILPGGGPAERLAGLVLAAWADRHGGGPSRVLDPPAMLPRLAALHAPGGPAFLIPCLRPRARRRAVLLARAIRRRSPGARVLVIDLGHASAGRGRRGTSRASAAGGTFSSLQGLREALGLFEPATAAATDPGGATPARPTPVVGPAA